MQSSIFNFFARIFHSLALWFDESIVGKLFNKVTSFFTNSFKSSLISRFFMPKGQGKTFDNSLFSKILRLPLTICQKIAVKISPGVKTLTESSMIVWFFRSWHSISIKNYGMVLISYSVCYMLFRLIITTPSAVEWIINGALIIIAILCILINRTPKSLFKGSSILTAIGGLFCKIRKDSDSKLFFKEPEFLLSTPLLAGIIGLIAAVFSVLLGPVPFLLILGGSIYLFVVLLYPILGVYSVIIAAPVLPTMLLAGLCILSTLSFLLHLTTDSSLKLRPVPLGGYVALFAFIYFLATLTSFSFIKSAQIFFIYISFILFYFVAFEVLDTKKKWFGAVSAFILISGLVAFYGVLQNFLGTSSTESWVDSNMFSNIKTRVYSTFDNPNVLGEYLVLLMPPALAILWKNKANEKKLLYGLLFLCLAACMVFTWSRGAWLGMILACGLFLMIMDKRYCLVGLLLILMVPLFLSSGSSIADRILSIGNTADTSTAYRVSIWQGSLKIIKDFWLGGIGLGSEPFTMIYPKYALAGANYALHAHNLYLQLWIESGICGILSFLMLLIAFFRQTLSRSVFGKRGKMEGAIIIGLSTGVLGFLLQALTDHVWYNYKMVLLFWIVLSLASSASAPDFDGGESE